MKIVIIIISLWRKIFFNQFPHENTLTVKVRAITIFLKNTLAKMYKIAW